MSFEPNRGYAKGDSWSRCADYTVYSSIRNVPPYTRKPVGMNAKDTIETEQKRIEKEILYKLKGDGREVKRVLFVNAAKKTVKGVLLTGALPVFYVFYKFPKLILIDLTSLMAESFFRAFRLSLKNVKKFFPTKNALLPLISALDKLKQELNKLNLKFQALLNLVTIPLNKQLQAGQEFISSKKEVLFNSLSNIWNQAKKKVSEKNQSTLVPGVNWFKSNVEDVSQSIQKHFDALLQKTKQSGKQAFLAIKKVITPSLAITAEGMKSLYKSTVKIAKPVADFIQERLKETSAALKKRKETVVNFASHQVEQVSQKVQEHTMAIFQMAKVPTVGTINFFLQMSQQSAISVSKSSAFRWAVAKKGVPAQVAAKASKLAQEVLKEMNRIHQISTLKLQKLSQRVHVILAKKVKTLHDQAKEKGKMVWEEAKKIPKAVFNSVLVGIHRVKQGISKIFRWIRYTIAFITVLCRFTGQLLHELFAEIGLWLQEA